MCSYAWIDLRGGCALSSAQGRRPREPSASTGTSFGWRDDVELFTTLALVVRSYSYNGGLNAFAARLFFALQFSVDARFGRFFGSWLRGSLGLASYGPVLRVSSIAH